MRAGRLARLLQAGFDHSRSTGNFGAAARPSRCRASCTRPRTSERHEWRMNPLPLPACAETTRMKARRSRKKRRALKAEAARCLQRVGVDAREHAPGEGQTARTRRVRRNLFSSAPSRCAAMWSMRAAGGALDDLAGRRGAFAVLPSTGVAAGEVAPALRRDRGGRRRAYGRVGVESERRAAVALPPFQVAIRVASTSGTASSKVGMAAFLRVGVSIQGKERRDASSKVGTASFLRALVAGAIPCRLAVLERRLLLRRQADERVPAKPDRAAPAFDLHHLNPALRTGRRGLREQRAAIRKAFVLLGPAAVPGRSHPRCRELAQRCSP